MSKEEAENYRNLVGNVTMVRRLTGENEQLTKQIHRFNGVSFIMFLTHNQYQKHSNTYSHKIKTR